MNDDAIANRIKIEGANPCIFVINATQTLNSNIAMKKYILKQHKTGLWSDTLLNRIRRQYLSKDEYGKYKPYIGILLWYINKKIK